LGGIVDILGAVKRRDVAVVWTGGGSSFGLSGYSEEEGKGDETPRWCSFLAGALESKVEPEQKRSDEPDSSI
jgi:hypothetical protein